MNNQVTSLCLQDGGANLSDTACVACNSGPEVGALLGDGSGDGGALHLSLVVHDHTRVILNKKVIIEILNQTI